MAGKLLNDEFYKNICLEESCSSLEEAIVKTGKLLVQNQYVTERYISGMLEREKECSTYIGFGVMVPHGTEESLEYVNQPGLCILRMKDGFSYRENQVIMMIGIACREEDSLQVLLQISDILVKPERRERLLHASSKQEFINVINENYLEEGEL
jgi:mannitol/fructose-specific phosphotransferase system IIA component